MLKQYITGKTKRSNEQSTQGKKYKRNFEVKNSDQSLEKCTESDQGNVYANTTFTGSNFTTDRPALLADAKEEGICLDGSYTTYAEDSEGKLVGVGVGLGDGNGHGDSDEENNAIAEVAHLAPKTIIKHLMEFENPDSLTHDTLFDIIKKSAKEINATSAVKKHGATTTVVAARTYPTAEGNRVIGVV